MRTKLLAVIGVFLLAPVYAALALPITSFNQIVVFGDSLSDNGNAYTLSGGMYPGANYATGEYTDGPNTSPKTTGPFGLWIDQFSAKTNLPALPFAENPAVNTNYAVASAQTGSANPQDISNQLNFFGAAHPTGAPSTAIYAIWGGANDLYNGTNSGKTAADNLEQNIASLAAGGAKYFLGLNLPQLGNTPLGAANQAALNAQSTAFDNEWTADLAALHAGGVYVIGVDINSLFTQILNNPSGFGFKDVKDPGQLAPANANANDYLFWDGEHPTTAGDALVANLAYSDLVAAPEPVSAGLGLIGMCAILAARRLRRKATVV